jgi:Calcium binding
MAKKEKDKDRARLDPLIEEATVDCYNEAEEHMGFMNMIDENVVCPFKATVIGEEVEVVELRSPEAGFGLNAVCRYKGKDYNIDINSLGWPKIKPEGFEWIEAFQVWQARL